MKYTIEKLIDGYGVKPDNTELPISVHETQREAERAVQRYKAADKRREG